VSLIDQAEVGLVNQRGRIERVLSMLVPELSGGDSATFVIDKRE
jgi:hypothetical protein